ncbi:MAG TPA: hypothetical protein VF316_22455 [Polyangiaceae bacterium]
MSAVLRVNAGRLYRWCSGLGGEYPRLILLLARGWRIDGVDNRYGSVWMSHEDDSR